MTDIVKSETLEKYTDTTNKGFADFYQLNKMPYNQYQKFCVLTSAVLSMSLKGHIS